MLSVKKTRSSLSSPGQDLYTEQLHRIFGPIAPWLSSSLPTLSHDLIGLIARYAVFATAAPNAKPRLIHKWGTPVKYPDDYQSDGVYTDRGHDGKFESGVWAIAWCAANDTVWCCDARLQVFRPNGEFLFRSFPLRVPRCVNSVCIDREEVYFVEPHEPAVQVVNLEGNFVRKIVCDRGPFDRPDGVACDGRGRIAVADNRSVHLMTRNGAFICDCLLEAKCIGNLGHVCLAFNAEGLLFVSRLDLRLPIVKAEDTDHDINSILVFDAEGKLVRKIGGSGEGKAQFNGPFGMAFDRANHLIVADRFGGRVQILTADGQFVTQFGCRVPWPERRGPADASDIDFHWPMGVAVCDDGSIIISDDKRVMVFGFELGEAL